MAKSEFEKALEKQTKEQKKQLDQKLRVETASSVVNGQPFVGGMRIMDEASEEIFQIILSEYNGNDDRTVSGNYDLLPSPYYDTMRIEFEKLKQYGVITRFFVYISASWEVILTPQGIHYFENKKEALSRAKNTQTNIEQKSRKDYEVFISHASKDKSDYVDSLTSVIRQLGVKIFYDTDVLSWGDNWKRVILDGTAQSEFAIIVISKNFFGREWTEIELNEFLDRQNESGQKIVLPLLHGISLDELKEQYPKLEEIQVIDTDNYSKEEIAILFAKELIKRYR